MKSRITIQDISDCVGVSTTTVTRALNGKPKVSEELRKKIVLTASTMGYKPNKTAQALARNKINICIIYPKEPIEFIRYLEAGIQKGIADLIDYKVQGIFVPVSDLNSVEGVRSALLSLEKQDVDGIIISVGFDFKDYSRIVEQLNKIDKPVMYLINDIGKTRRAGYIKLNGQVAGQVAAQFLDLCMDKDRRSVAVLTANKEDSIHRDCIEGFTLGAELAGIQVRGVYETQNDKRITYYLTEKIVHEIPDIGGIYVSSYNSVTVCNCLEDLHLTDKIKVIGQDLYPELAAKLISGSLTATLYQDPFKQGETAVLKIYQYITEGSEPGDILTTPQLVLKSNLECYQTQF
jgi:LacI family transcriptional regulator